MQVSSSKYMCFLYTSTWMKEITEGKHLGTSRNNIVHMIDRSVLLTKDFHPTINKESIQPHSNRPQPGLINKDMKYNTFRST